MAEVTLVVSALAASVASGLFLSAGLAVQRQRVGADAREVMMLFSVWWLGLALYAVGGASQDLLAGVGLATFPLFIALRYLQIIAICIGLWGLMCYVSFILTGKRSLVAPLAAFYSVYYAAVLFLVTRGIPAGIEADAWHTALVFATPVLSAFAGALLLVIPPLVAACTYFALFLHARSPSQRLRVALVTLSTFAWSAGLLMREFRWASMGPAALGIVAGWSVTLAYQPPEWVRKRLGDETTA